MVFSSYIFILLFLPFSIIGYYLLNHFTRKSTPALFFLTGMSLLFYGYNNIRYVPVIAGSILANWLISRLLNSEVLSCLRQRRLVLFGGLAANIGLIFYFKYFDFFFENVSKIFPLSFEARNILLPLGISFFTFQQISFLVDSYRGETGEYNFIEYATFVSFFPQLVAGPIVLHNEMIPQFQDLSKRKPVLSNIVSGIQLFSFGLFKKVLLADTFARAVDWGFSNSDIVSSADIIIVMLSYTFQIYFDFSGYSDMATGIARMINIRLPINFDSPYRSFSMREFWRRWHMTLTRFLTKYIYFPLGGSYQGTGRTYLNMMIVYLISGIWHGANWTFILWGILNGIFCVLERHFSDVYQRVNRGVRYIYTFIMINVLWLLFRSDTVSQWILLLKRMLSFRDLSLHEAMISSFAKPEFDFLSGLLHLNGLDAVYYLPMTLIIIFSFVICLAVNNNYHRQFRQSIGSVIFTAFILIWCVVSLSSESVFIYFNF